MLFILFLATPAMATEMSIEYGHGAKIAAFKSNGYDTLGISVSQSFGVVKTSYRLMTYDRTQVVAANVGLYTPTRLFVGMSIGGAYFTKVPANMTGHMQFEIGLESGYKFTEKISASVYTVHYSNGADFNIGNYPNDGIEFVGVKITYNMKGKTND